MLFLREVFCKRRLLDTFLHFASRLHNVFRLQTNSEKNNFSTAAVRMFEILHIFDCILTGYCISRPLDEHH